MSMYINLNDYQFSSLWILMKFLLGFLLGNNNDEMRLCLSLPFLILLDMVFHKKIKASSSCNDHKYSLFASNLRTVLVSSDYTDYSTGLMKCSWVIQGNGSQAITFQMSHMITQKTVFCGEDYVIIRDGSSGKGPPLGYWCKDGRYETEVTSYSNAIFVELETFSNGAPGLYFVLTYWKSSMSSSVEYGPIEYGVVNYVLISFSILIGSLLLGAVIFLSIREYKKHMEMKEMKFREKLLMRRTGISGRSGGFVNDDFRHDSESEKTTSYIFLSPTPTSEISL